jgi:hypothetical protein
LGNAGRLGTQTRLTGTLVSAKGYDPSKVRKSFIVANMLRD